jgi:hypothetical protein
MFMSHKLICSWLGLPEETWPPDHYLLLGLEPGEGDAERIERHVHERLELFRRYQLIHPEQVTEAMNRLAQAFLCLTDPKAKRAYDTELLGAAYVPELVGAAAENADPLGWLFGAPGDAAPELAGPIADLHELDWNKAPPPERVLARTDIPALPKEFRAVPIEEARYNPPPIRIRPPTPSQAETASFQPAKTAIIPPSAEESSPGVQKNAEMPSRSARRGLGTKRALYHRVAKTRQLLHTWEQCGKYLSQPKRRLNRPSEAIDLIQQLGSIRGLIQELPPLLGHPGQPGYLVVSLARQQVVVPTLQTLLPSQREKLAEDWRLGQQALLNHRQFLRYELRSLRKKTVLGRVVRATRAFLDQPGGILLLLALLALNIAIWKSRVHTDWLHSTPPPNSPAPTQHTGQPSN